MDGSIDTVLKVTFMDGMIGEELGLRPGADNDHVMQNYYELGEKLDDLQEDLELEVHFKMLTDKGFHLARGNNSICIHTNILYYNIVILCFKYISLLGMAPMYNNLWNTPYQVRTNGQLARCRVSNEWDIGRVPGWF